MRPYYLMLILVGSLYQAASGADGFPAFQERTIDPEIGKVCYAVTLADVDGDGKQDIVAVSENRVLWYQNPTWKPRVIIKDQTPRDNVCIAPYDIDGDGRVDFALGAGWTKIGTIHWITRSESLDVPWQVHSIGEELWLHRMRWADVLGTGRSQLVISPLRSPEDVGVRLMALEIPKDPVKDRWKPTVINGELNRMHNHWHIDFDGRGEIDTLTASREGVHLVRRSGGDWSSVKLGRGVTVDDINKSGAGEIKTGRLADGKMFIVTVEPMHGDHLAVYTSPDEPGDLWKRHVVDQGFQRGHALWTSDVDADGADEIVFGHSDTPEVPGVSIYDAQDSSGSQWTKHVIDAGGMATEDLIVADLTGDGRPDIVAGGRATHNVKLYVQQ
jgi:hypothetical protein